MALSLESIIKFQEGSGLCIKLISDRDANGLHELPEIVSNLQEFYSGIYSDFMLDPKFKEAKSAEGYARLYTLLVRSGKDDYAGTIKIIPKGQSSKADSRPNEDYAIADPTHYYESYFVFFFIKDKPKRQEHRDAFARFIDPSESKTKMQEPKPGTYEARR